ncbi:MAG TPA: maleylpyruvate isomerase family mycothiol-dependent enzyme [Nakamurella sp.]|nr:maleylpyruvate isomerase family mycothiol-dependent enzyme [Nakamurella sp.]
MTTMAPTRPRTGALPRDEAMRLAATEYQRLVDLLGALRPQDWTAPTDCIGWDVRSIAAHALGMIEMAASIRETIRQNRAAGRLLLAQGGLQIDALTAVQVGERAAMTPEQLLARIAARAPKAAAARRRTPGLIRRRRLPIAQQVGDSQEMWTLGYLIDVILTRDPWMHRIDIVRATGAPHVLTPEHDGRLVADVVAEWAARHGKPYTLRLSGPAGGEWSTGMDGPVIAMDAVQFCRVVSGRGSHQDLPADAKSLLATAVPF